LRTGLQFIAKTKKGLMMFILSILVFVGVVVMAMIMSGDVDSFINVPSFLIVVPPSVLITLACTSKQSQKNAFALLLSEDLSLDKIELSAAKHAFTTFGNMNMFMAWIAVIVGAIAMANSINGDNFTQAFGPSFAVCILGVFYGFLLKGLCYAAEAKIQFKIINLG
jgi:chemotaxis protein MotA